MLRFRAKTLHPVLDEALTNQCNVILVKDHGVYFMSDVGATNDDGKRVALAYADGCNPDVDSFDDWWTLSRKECGGDDFGENFDANDPIFWKLLSSNADLLVKFTERHIFLTVDEHKSQAD